MSNKNPSDSFEKILGISYTKERLEQNLSEYGDILVEIEKLRSLDLTEIHPPVVFDPTAVYRQWDKK